jgi:hypothetical protein
MIPHFYIRKGKRLLSQNRLNHDIWSTGRSSKYLKAWQIPEDLGTAGRAN